MENRAQKLLESLTPGGSEFYNDPEYCVKYIKEFETSQHKKITTLMADKKSLAAQNNDLLAALQTCWASLQTYGEHPIIERQVENAIKKAI